jgi:acyl-CoA thioester hydrolase
MVRDGADMVVAELQVRYLGSARFDDEIDVIVEVHQLGETSLTCGWRIERDDDVLVEGTMRQVCIDPQTKRKRSLPDDVRSALA